MIEVDQRVADVAAKGLPGFYFDCRGVYCGQVNGRLVSVFVNTEENTIDVTVDELDSATGIYDNCIDWESHTTVEGALDSLKQACHLAASQV